MKETLISAFLNFAGPATFLLFLLWLHSLKEYFPRVRDRETQYSIFFSFLGAVVAFTSCFVGLKVLSDETNLLSVANMIALFGKASNTESWLYYYHTYHALDVSVPARPILFPVLTAAVHAVIGVRPTSAFVVNFFCLWAFLLVSLEWGRRTLPQMGRSLTWFAVMMSPVFLITSTSAGYDLCNLMFAWIAVLLWGEYARSRRDETLRALFLTLVCFASVRYESIVALPMTVVAVFLLDRKKPIPYDLYATVALFVLPLFVQRYLTWGSFENPPGVAPFSPSHFAKYFPQFLKTFFADGRGPYPIVIHWLGVGGLVMAARSWRREHFLTAAYAGFVLVLLLSHHFGLASHPTQARLFLPLTAGLSLLGIYFLASVWTWVDRWAVLGVFAVLFFHHHQYAVHDPLSTQLTMTREVRFLRDFIDEEVKQTDLFVYDRPGQITALGHSAISWTQFDADTKGFLTNLRNKLYTRIFVIERVKYAGPAADSDLVRSGYRLFPLSEHQLSPDERLRVSRVDW